jgi:hypothetical protein
MVVLDGATGLVVVGEILKVVIITVVVGSLDVVMAPVELTAVAVVVTGVVAMIVWGLTEVTVTVADMLEYVT